MSAADLRPICFMVMPFNLKSTGLPAGSGPPEVNFDVLWDKAFAPALHHLGYEAVRADSDTGVLIIQEMLERLTLADLVIADLSIPNGNVYYEVGVRHAAKPNGCVLISADWTKPLFDVAQFRRITYPLPQAVITDEQAAKIREVLESSIHKFREEKSPPHCLEGFPRLNHARSSSFRKFVEQLSAFQAEVKTARLESSDERRAQIEQLCAKYVAPDNDGRPVLPGVAQELLYLVRDALEWPDTVSYINRLPPEIQNLPLVREQYCLAMSKTGKHPPAIAALEQLVKNHGDTSERQGLIGGRYKKLFLASTSEIDKQRYLSKAIEHYERGMFLDLNDYYPSCNLPRLLMARNRGDDVQRAQAIAHLVGIACERAHRSGKQDDWLKPTLLTAAFEAKDLAKAEDLVTQIEQEGPIGWHIESVVPDLIFVLQFIDDSIVRVQFQPLIERLQKLLPPPPQPPQHPDQS